MLNYTDRKATDNELIEVLITRYDDSSDHVSGSEREETFNVFIEITR